MHRTKLLVSLFVFAAALSGCDTMNWQQYRVLGVRAGSEDAQRLKVVVSTVASKYGLDDVTPTSHVPNTLIFVKETRVEDFHTDIGVRIYGEDAIVDVMAGFGPRVPKFLIVRDALQAELKESFGPRSVTVPLEQRVQVR
jgi:hypothetical protein